MTPRRALLAALPALALLPRAAAADTPPIFAPGGIALGGTDPVAYFTEGRPVAGRADLTHRWNGATWRFATEAHRAAFAADPEAYAPQYGGYCAWAVARNYTAKTEPEAWRIENGKLYLNYDLSIRRRWARDIPGNVARADANWPDVLSR